MKKKYDLVKKSLKSIAIGCILILSFFPKEAQSATLATGIYTNNVFTNFPGVIPPLPHLLSQVILANPSTNSVTLYLYDIPTNSLTVTNAAYTNTITTLSNYVWSFTNYYGYVEPALTNTVIIDNTNNAVAAGTNTVPPKMVLTCLPSTTVSVQGVHYYFYQGLWVSNATAYGAGTNATGANAPQLTITYQ
jgi:hypothetical protein